MAWAWVEELIALVSNTFLNEDRDEQSMRLELTLSYKSLDQQSLGTLHLGN